jgi:hypothetical protein
MAKVFDPTDLDHIVDAGGTVEDLEIQTGAKTIEITTDGNIVNVPTGALSGVTGKCVYSKLKEIWKTDDDLNKHKFPIQMIYEASFVWINGWGPLDQTTRDLIRDAGFQETDGRENACIISLGAMDAATDQPYYTNDFTAEFNEDKVDFTFAGEINENITTKGTGGSPDDSGYLKVFLREEQKTFASYDLISEQGLAALKFEAYRLPVANGDDSLKAIDDDTTISGDAGSESGVTYSELTIDYINGARFETASLTGGASSDGVYAVDDVVQDGDGRWARCTATGTAITAVQSYASFGGTSTWEAYPGERQVGATYYAFNRIIDVEDTGNTKARLKEIHSWTQWKCRQTADINDDVGGDTFGSVKGNIALQFTDFIGDTLHTKPGVFIDGYDTNDKNDIRNWDITVDAEDVDAGLVGLDTEYAPLTSTEREFPFVAAGNINFSQNFVDEVDNTTRYTMYFQYIKSQAMTALKVTGSSGADCTLDWTGADAGLLDFLQSGDYIFISGFTTETGNNGLYEITGAPTTNTVTASKVDGVNPTDEATGDSCTVLENPFESPKATIVDNNAAADIDGEISAASIGFDFDYTNNNQEGRTANSNAPIYVVAIAFDGAQYVIASHTITKTTGQNVPVNAVDELNYENP